MEERRDLMASLDDLRDDIARQRVILADRRARGRTTLGDEQLLAEMENVMAEQQAGLRANPERARLLRLAHQCRNQAAAAMQQSTQSELLQMADEYFVRANALKGGGPPAA